MAPKIFKQFFATDYTGIDGESTPLEEDSGGVNRAINLEYAVGNSLRGRTGIQIAGSIGNFFGLFPYSYTRTQDEYSYVYSTPSGTFPNQTGSISTIKTNADGASINKVVAINQQLWVRDLLSFVVTRVSGTYPFTWYTTVSGSNINFVIKANGSAIVNQSCGDGLSTTNTDIQNFSIFNLLNTIDATAELSISRTTRGTCPPFAIINGNQTAVGGASLTYGTQYTLTVDAGHNFQEGDIITFPYPYFAGGFVSATAATTITYVGQQVTLSDNDILGYMGQTAAAFPIAAAQSVGSGSLTIRFPYWRLVPEGDSWAANSWGEPFHYSFASWNASVRADYSFWSPPVAEEMQGNLFIASSAPSTTSVSTYANNLIKSDNVQLHRVGLPSISIAVTPTVGTGDLTGTYKYKVYLKKYDAQGNIVEGPLSSVTTATYAGADYGAITLDTTNVRYATRSGFSVRSCYKNTTATPSAGQFFYVDDNVSANNPAFIQPGDVLCYLDTTAQKDSGTGSANEGLWHFVIGTDRLGALHKTRCTAYCPQDGTSSPTASSIKAADSDGVISIPDNSEISAGLTAVVLRTTVGGNTFYELCEVPITGYSANFTFFDSVLDSVLIQGVQFEEPTLGKEHDAPPPCSLVCEHQGGLVVAKGLSSPNTVAFSSTENIEYFPTASNSFDVPSTQSGFVTAIASDTNDRLAVFKKRAYYDVQGDLDGGIFSVNVKTEGDFGITSQATLVRVQEVLIGLSRNGFILVSDGTLAWKAYKDINTRLIDRGDLKFEWAIACNDSLARSYICMVSDGSETSPECLVIDYSREVNHTFERQYSEKMWPSGGMISIDDDLFHLSQQAPYAIFRRLERFDGNSPTGNDGDHYIDNTAAINYVLESNPISNDEPALLKTPQKIRVWSLPNDYVKEGWLPFATQIETGLSPLVTYCGGTNQNATNSTVTFLTTNDIFLDVILKKMKSFFMIVRLTTNTIRTAPFWTGFEVMYADDYNKEDLIK